MHREPDANERRAQARAALHPAARGLFDRLGVECEVAAPRAEVERFLRLRNVPASVHAFEETFGGLLIPCAGHVGWRAKGLFSTVGAYHTLRAWERSATDLVPVCITHFDFIHYLDGAGRGWTHDTIEGPGPVLVSNDGAGLVTFLIACELLDGGDAQAQGSAASIAREKGLELICAGGVEVYASATWLLLCWPTGLLQLRSL